MTKKIISISTTAIAIAIFVFWSSAGELSMSQVRMASITIFAACFWILEPIPIFATSVLIVFLEVLFLSDQTLRFFPALPESQIVDYREILYSFSSPIIFLFLGGFFLAMAATKFRLDQNLARILLKPFGKQPKAILLGLMLVTAVFSMFMSNTATTAMMLSILVPVLALFPSGDPGRIAFALAIPVAANVGGIGTPIGTPPNAIAMKYLTGENAIGFSQWMSFGVPFVLLLLLFGWLLLLFLYPPKVERLELSIKGSFLRNRKAYIVYGTFVGTILLWLTDFFHGLNSYVVALFPVVIFLSFGIIGKQDLKNISWDVLWLVTGGIALGLGLEKSGLAAYLVRAIPFSQMMPVFVVLMLSLMAAFMANFMSNTATANLLLPLVAVLGTAIPELGEIGGSRLMVLSTTMACSMGMALPISTPPNALAYGTGLFATRDMALPGIILAVFGLLASYALMFILKLTEFI